MLALMLRNRFIYGALFVLPLMLAAPILSSVQAQSMQEEGKTCCGGPCCCCAPENVEPMPENCNCEVSDGEVPTPEPFEAQVESNVTYSAASVSQDQHPADRIQQHSEKATPAAAQPCCLGPPLFISNSALLI
jgi:hypothetical protein